MAAIGQGAEVEDIDDVAVPDLVDGTRLGHEPLDRGGLVRELRLEDLDRGTLADQRMRRDVHDSHPAAAEDALDHVAADVRAGRELFAFYRGGLFVGEHAVERRALVFIARWHRRQA